ncbi:cuticle protein 10.9-like [Tachypleus tridentatus]|uniref:cuticle protein 10.9-like n=1 Tax=Tachypleus tridentatus TaxID=6853 RepID=UPI003FD4F691
MLKVFVFLAVVAGVFGGNLLDPYAYPAAYHPDPYYAAPEPYEFGFDTTDEFGTQLSRHESGDASGAVTGSYGYADANGIWRKVNYVADAGGFRAQVDTSEPGTANQNPADVTINSNPVAAPVVYKHPVVKHVIPAVHAYAPYGHPRREIPLKFAIKEFSFVLQLVLFSVLKKKR